MRQERETIKKIYRGYLPVEWRDRLGDDQKIRELSCQLKVSPVGSNRSTEIRKLGKLCLHGLYVITLNTYR